MMPAKKKKSERNISSSLQDAFLIGVGVADIAVSRMKREIYQLLRNNNIDTEQARDMASRLIDDVETRKDLALKRLNEKTMGADSVLSELLSGELKKKPASNKGYSKSVRKTPSKKTSKKTAKKSAKKTSRNTPKKSSKKKTSNKKR
ncbi:MAG: SDH family Clp fold serine proteinase [Nanobdellota archaeon]